MERVNISLAPEGWHVPSDEEWQELIDFVGGNSVAGNQLKSVDLWNEEGNGSDMVGFTAIPAGWRAYTSIGFDDMRSWTFFWSSIEGPSRRDGLRLALTSEISFQHDNVDFHSRPLSYGL